MKRKRQAKRSAPAREDLQRQISENREEILAVERMVREIHRLTEEARIERLPKSYRPKPRPKST